LLTAENIHVGKLQEYIDEIRWENTTLAQQVQEAKYEIEQLNNEIEKQQKQMAAKDETVENMRQNIQFLTNEGAGSKRGSSVSAGNGRDARTWTRRSGG
jgi:phage-related minor tail protein